MCPTIITKKAGKIQTAPPKRGRITMLLYPHWELGTDLIYD